MSRKPKLITPRKVIGLALIAVITISGIIIFTPRQTEYPLSELERSSLEEHTAKAINYLEEVDSSDILYDHYIAYALEYAYNEENKSSLSTAEIKKIIDSHFDIGITENNLKEVGISPYLVDKNVTCDSANHIYNIRKDTDKQQLASTPITKYITKKIYTNKEKTIYTVVYDKYVIKNPYDALPYVGGQIKNYLDGKIKIAALKDAISESNVKEITNPEKETTVEYTLKDGKPLIKSIR